MARRSRNDLTQAGRDRLATGHTNLAPIVRTAFDASWAEATDDGTVRGVLPVEPDGPSTLYRPHAERKKQGEMFEAFPDLTKPTSGGQNSLPSASVYEVT